MLVAISAVRRQNGDHLAQAFLRLPVGRQHAQAGLQCRRLIDVLDRLLDRVYDLAVDADRTELRLKHHAAGGAGLRELVLMQNAKAGDRRIDNLHRRGASEGTNRLHEYYSMKAPPF